MMKKIVLVVFVLLVALAAANASIFVTWNLTGALADVGKTPNLGDASTAAWSAGDSVLWALVWSSSNVLSPVDYEAFYDVAKGMDDVDSLELLATRTVNTTVGDDFGQITSWAKAGATEASDGAYLTQWFRQNGPAVFEFDGLGLTKYDGGFLYQAVFVEDAGGYSYFISKAFDFDETLSGDQATPESFLLSYDQGTTGLSMQDYHQAIPEPTTMALLGMGGLALALRRKLRK